MPRWFRQVALAGVVAAGMSSQAQAQFIPVAPTASFIRTSAGDSPTSPVVVPLSGYADGSMLRFTVGSGLLMYTFGSPLVNAPFIALFSTSGTVLSADQVDRVPGAVAPAGGDISLVSTPPTFFGGLPTDVMFDFILGGAPGTVFEIEKPVDAEFLLLGISDSYFADNSTPDPANFGLMLGTTTSTVPEPFSMALLGTGLAGVAAVRRRKRREAEEV